MDFYLLPLYIFFGVLPSLIWMSYYLGKDPHPEPQKMVLKFFIFGALVTVPVFFVQLSLYADLRVLQSLSFFSSNPLLNELLKWFFIIAFIEEGAKYLIFEILGHKNKEIDEPLDIMLYMVIVALGFAALENILYVLSPSPGLSLSEVIGKTVAIAFIRFIGATFLHTLCSALVGYFAAMSFYNLRHRHLFALAGLLLATLLHGLYDFSIIALGGPVNFAIPIFILMGLALLVVPQFDKLKNLKSICKLK